MLNKKIEIINLTLFVFLFVICLFVNEYFFISAFLSSAGIAYNIYLYFFNRENLPGGCEKEDTGINEKNAILKDLDKELKRRKKEDNFLRN